MTSSERAQFTQELLPLARQLARGVARVYPRADYEELYADACLGIARALDKYDATRGVPLQAFARRVMSGAIFNGIRKMDPVTDFTRKRVREAAGLSAGTADRSLREAMTAVFRARTAVSLESGGVHGALDIADAQPDPAQIVSERNERQALAQLIRELPEKERKVLSMFYFGDLEPKTIGTLLHLTVQRVYQLRKSALLNLRSRIPVQP